jgi:hypothetical protein
MESQRSLTAFAGDRLIATGPAAATLLKAKQKLARSPNATVLVFDDASGRQVDFDWRGTDQAFLDRLPSHPFLAQDYAAEAPRGGPGRPKLGVTSREVTLLPRHWDWLQAQPQGASATLRRLVDEAVRGQDSEGGGPAALAAADKFMWALAGDKPGCEEASRALYARDWARFRALVQRWPKDLRAHLLRLLKPAMAAQVSAGSPS